jgi:hypothetical protein
MALRENKKMEHKPDNPPTITVIGFGGARLQPADRTMESRCRHRSRHDLAAEASNLGYLAVR